MNKSRAKAVGVWFPDLPGCFSAGDTLDEAMLNAQDALGLWAEAMLDSGQAIPVPRSLAEIRTDAGVAPDLRRSMFTLIPLPENLRARAAE